MLSLLFDEDAADAEGHADGAHTNGGFHLVRPPLPRPALRLCGLDNLGATCYLNALLQTLHFTPELRQLLFQLGREELGDIMQPESRENQIRCIPIQLQRLFAQLLLLNQQSCSTDMLTDSFGWTSREELQQHDVQELNRILFSAIESSLVGTSGEKLIASLYHGTIVNKIACESCDFVSEREEDFLDVAIPVMETNGLEVGLSQLFIDLELMEGPNQYHCDHCKKKVNATKGCRLKKLPDILPFALLRFQYDFVKGERYKETCKFTFPEELDMNPYCEEESSDENYFDLFSVVVHRGSTHGGHYFAYIKDVDALGQWTHPDEEEIHVPCAPESGKVDFIDCDSPVDLMKMLVEQLGGGPVSINRLCKELQEQTGVSWNKRFKRLYGPVKQFFTRTCDVFTVDSTGMVSLQKGNSSDQKGKVKNETPQMRVGGTFEPDGTDGTHELVNSDGSEVHVCNVIESHNQIISPKSQGQVASVESRDQIALLESPEEPIHQADLESLHHPGIEVQNSEIANSSHTLEIDVSESLPMVEDYFQAPEVPFEFSTEISENGESHEASRQNRLSNSDARLRFSPPLGHCWFSFDDLWVRPITDRTLRTAYQGKESAYMLFYRRRALLRPREALQNPLYGVPDHLVEEMHQANATLQDDRDKYDVAVNAINLNVHFGGSYTHKDGALYPAKDTGVDSCIQLTLDRRKTVGELREIIVSAREELEEMLGAVCVNKAKQLPAGVHLYEQLEDLSKSMKDYDVANGSHLFVWNGTTVGDHIVTVGADCEPLLLIVSYSVDGDSNQTVTEHRHGYPKNMTVSELRRSLSDLTGIPLPRLQLTKVKLSGTSTRSGLPRATVLERSQDSRSLQQLGLEDGERLTAELQVSKGQGSLVAAEVARQNRMMSFVVESRCCVKDENEPWPVFPIEVDRDETVGMLKAVILSEMALFDITVQGNVRMRGDDDTHGLGLPVHEHLTICTVGWTQGQKIVIECGDAPLENQVVLNISLNVTGSDKDPIELTADRNLSTAELLTMAVISLGQTGDAWHLRKTNWCGEAADVLEDEEATLEQQHLKDGDHLMVEEGKLPPKGFVRLSISRRYPASEDLRSTDISGESQSTIEWVTQGIKGLLSAVVGQHTTPTIQCDGDEGTQAEEQTSFSFPSIAHIGDVEISKEACLADLKAQIMTLPEMCLCDLPSLNFLRLQELQGSPPKPTKVYRRMDLTLKRHKVSSSTKTCCTVLDHEEMMSQSSILLNVKLRLPERRQYGPALEVVFDATSIPTPQALRQCIADKLGFPLNSLVIAKHFPEKSDWLIIKGASGLPVVVSASKGKGRKKGNQAPAQKKTNVRNSPYFLKDGDTIGVQLSSVDRKDLDFSTQEDDEGRAILKAKEEEKRRLRKERRQTDALGGKSHMHRRAEVGIKIFVPDYQRKTEENREEEQPG